MDICKTKLKGHYLAALLLAASSSLAQENTPLLFKELSRNDVRLTSLDFRDAGANKTIARSRIVELDADVLTNRVLDPSADVSEGREVRLQLFSDVVVTVTTKSDPTELLNKRISWTGRTKDSNHTNAVFLINPESGSINGSILIDNIKYLIQPIEGNLQEILELDQTQFPDEAEPTPPDDASLDQKVQPTGELDGEEGSLDGGESAVVDVLVIYTPAAKRASTDITGEISLAIQETNVSYMNSGIPQRIRLVHEAEVDYEESGSVYTDRNALRGQTDGKLDGVHALRDLHGADVVSLWIESGNACGVAYIMTNVNAAFRDAAFSVVRRDCATGYFSFGHEFGHIMSARHNWEADSTDQSPYRHNHGYVNIAKGWRTIMGYNHSSCPDRNGRPYCTRIQLWSNPDVTYSGDPVGVPITGNKPSDNTLTLEKTGSIVSSFR